VNERPKNVPPAWTSAPCSACQRTTWFDPGARAEAEAHGVGFTVVCSAACAREVMTKLVLEDRFS
jgi:hypothetical protein